MKTDHCPCRKRWVGRLQVSAGPRLLHLTLGRAQKLLAVALAFLAAACGPLEASGQRFLFQDPRGGGRGAPGRLRPPRGREGNPSVRVPCVRPRVVARSPREAGMCLSARDQIQITRI